MKYKYKEKKQLLSSSTFKMTKSSKFKYLSEILHLAPSKIGGVNICANASPVCIDLCLNTSGRGQMTSVQKSRLNKKFYFLADRLKFLNHLDREIKLSYERAKRKKLKYSIRLNGTSDISWENTGIIDEYKNLIWYDYTKVYKRALKFVNGQLPKNYHLTYSLNEDNKKQAFDILKKGGNISAVFRKDLPRKFNGYKVINADDSDLRFLDGHNIIAGLVAKGKARKDYSGFVLDV